MSAEDNLGKQFNGAKKLFKWTPHKFGRDVAYHMRREHEDMTPKGGWSATLADEQAHAAAHEAEENGVTGTVPHKHFTPKGFR